MSDIKNCKHKKTDNSLNIEIAYSNNKKGGRTVLLSDLDELNAVGEDLKILTYLKILVQEDFAGGYSTVLFDSQSKDSIDMYLLEAQLEKVRNLECLMEKISQ